jgi:hypothetical protein
LQHLEAESDNFRAALRWCARSPDRAENYGFRGTDQAELDRDLVAGRALLDDATWAGARTEGRQMGYAEALQYALEAIA